MTLAAMGVWSIMGPFWALPTRILGGRAAAGGVAIITMVGGLGGFTGPFLTGRLKDLTHGFSGGLYTIAGFAAVGAVLCFALKTPSIHRISGARAHNRSELPTPKKNVGDAAAIQITPSLTEGQLVNRVRRENIADIIVSARYLAGTAACDLIIVCFAASR